MVRKSSFFKINKLAGLKESTTTTIMGATGYTGYAYGGYHPINLDLENQRLDLTPRLLPPKALFDIVFSYVNAEKLEKYFKTYDNYESLYNEELKRVKKENKDLPLTQQKLMASQSTKQILAKKYIIDTFDVGRHDKPFESFSAEQVDATINALTKSPTENTINHLMTEFNIEDGDPIKNELEILMEKSIKDTNQLQSIIMPYIVKKVDSEYVPTTKIMSTIKAEKQKMVNEQVNNYTKYITNMSGQNTSLMDSALANLKVKKKQQEKQNSLVK